jgi:hypothetical protein
MPEHITRDKVEIIRKIKIYNISLLLTTGVKNSRNATKLVTIDLVLVKPC